MIDDFVNGERPMLKKTKTIEPLSKTPLTPIGDFKDDDPSPEPAFQPPHMVAVAEAPEEDADEPAPAAPTTGTHNGKKPFVDLKNWQWTLSKKATIIYSVAALLLIGGGATAAVWAHRTKPEPVVTTKHKAAIVTPPKPLIIYSNLTGLPVADATVNQRPVTGVMIENSTDARPQSGINQAGVVFEAIAEGGITRFLTLYQDSQPDYLGPVRSLRPYYLQWCMGFDCSIAHVGGSPEALQDVKTWGAKDLDQFFNSVAYHRITTRYAPHNVYTSTAELNQLEAGKGFGASSYTGFARKDDQPYAAPAAATTTPSTSKTKTTVKTPAETRTPASSIDFAISGFYYNAHFDYDAASNSYKRSQAGAPHMALNKDGSQTQIQPKVVVAMVMQYGLEADDHHSQYNVVGSGPATIFQDGVATAATWSKTDTKAPLTLKDAAGKDIALNRGQTWLTALSAASQATYK